MVDNSIPKKPVPKAVIASPIVKPTPVAKPVPTPVAKSPETIPAILAAKVEAPKPVAATPVSQPVAPLASAPAVIAESLLIAPKAVEPAVSEGKTLVNDTMNNVQDTVQNFTADATARATDMFGDVSARAKTAMEKSSKSMEEIAEFSKGNLEAVVASGRIAVKGVQDIAKYSAEFGRKSIEDANATAKKFAAVKSPTEFFALQSEVAKIQLDAFVGEASKFTESYMKLLGEMVQPMQNRYAVAVEKVKTAVAA